MSPLPKILALDDDKSWLSQIPLIFEDLCQVDGYASIDQGLTAIQSSFYEIILLDINFDGDPRSGLDVFRMIQAADRGADVIVISGETNPQRLIQIMNAGVTQFLTKPVTPDIVLETVKNTLAERERRLRAQNLFKSERTRSSLIGESLPMRKLREDISRMISSGTKDILLQGETGTGKEVVAQAIAYEADPSHRFVPIHCGAISDGLAESELFGHVRGAFTGADRDRASAFEVAGGGFVFLDEIGDMPLNQQAKLLRVIQERKITRVGSSEQKDVNFRTISATHVDLESAIAQKRFREDLYFRIAKAKVVIPPLRERLDDIPMLVQTFIASNQRHKHVIVPRDAVELLQHYHWPGNVRQLQSAIDSILMRITEPVIREKDICQAIPEIAKVFGNKSSKILLGRYGASLLARERDRFERAIIASNGDRDVAANSLGMSRATFFRRAKELGLVRERRVRDRGVELR